MDSIPPGPKPPQRPVTYLRVSVTDRCNLSCFYCLPVAGLKRMEHAEILSYEEILRVIRVAAAAGVTKVRVTGGEPLVRKDVLSLVERAAAVPGIRELCLTTNGTRLAALAKPLKDAGLTRINVSLDSLKPGSFRSITGADSLPAVLEGLDAAREAGFSPIKLNTVVMAGINDGEIADFAALTLTAPYWVRFIEFMPIGGPWTRERVVATAEMKRAIEERLGPLAPAPAAGADAGPAEMFTLPGALGRVGFIGAVSGHFCDSCNRMRLTADGRLKPCLFSDIEVDVKGPLRAGCDEAALAEIYRRAIGIKPRRRPEFFSCNNRPMRSIGG